MITCDLMGGLGNQLFQIFTTISYALKESVEYKFLNKTTLGGNGCTLRYTFWNTFFRKLQPTLMNKYPELVLVKELNFKYTDLLIANLLKTRNVCIHGYFQSYKYFDSDYYTIYNLLKIDELKQEVLEKLETHSDELFFTKNDLSTSVSMHFRLGDYKEIQDTHPILNYHYYYNSLKYLITQDKN